MEYEDRFKQIWLKSKRIHGAFTEREAKFLFQVAMGLESPAEIVEVGTFHGRSASILGQVARLYGHHLTCVDSFVNVPKGSPYEGKGTGIEHILKNLDALGIHFMMMMMPSVRAAERYDRLIDMLFVDADHSYEAVKLDCESWLPKLKVGGWALFHDYVASDPRKGVRRAVDELVGYEDCGTGIEGGTMKAIRKVGWGKNGHRSCSADDS